MQLFILDDQHVVPVIIVILKALLLPPIRGVYCGYIPFGLRTDIGCQKHSFIRGQSF